MRAPSGAFFADLGDRMHVRAGSLETCSATPFFHSNFQASRYACNTITETQAKP